MPSYLFEITFYMALMAASIRIAAPLIFAAVGEAFAERAGVVNIGLEGTMLLGAWAAFMATYSTGSSLVGVAAAVVAGMLLTLILAYVCISRGANQIIAGIVLNIFAVGATTLVFRQTFRLTLPSITSLKPYPLPLLSEIPLVGAALFRHTLLVYAAFLVVPLAAFVIYRTHLGLCMRAAGEHPAAVDAAGVDVMRVRYAATILCGALGGLAGAALSIGQLNQFTDNLTAGRGFIALAICLLGRWDPVRVMFASLLFAGADALQLRLQVLGFAVPKEVLGMIPYLLAIAAMAVLVGRLHMPAAMARPYLREH
jgi:simple sugar transport system permease protein